MQRHTSEQEGQAPKPLMQRLDRIFGELNAVLAALAIGLAVLDATCFYALKIGEAITEMPAATTISAPAPAGGAAPVALPPADAG